MAKFPTEAERSVTVKVPIEHAYQFLWDVVGSSDCIPGVDTCTRVGDDTYRFVYQERSTGPVSLTVQYTAHYKGNGKDEIRFEGIAAKGDNTDVTGVIKFKSAGPGATKVTLKQTLAPDTPVPRLLQGLIRSFVEREAADAMKQYLANVKQTLES
ncbi:MAG TPA: SRPBCC family protein [Candidatus Binatia bacterium]|nr:SRPBCC family protein [Candidatus Binatia bacterium]